MFLGPKGYIAEICEVHLQYGNSTTKWRFYTFFDLIPLYACTFLCPLPLISNPPRPENQVKVCLLNADLIQLNELI